MRSVLYCGFLVGVMVCSSAAEPRVRYSRKPLAIKAVAVDRRQVKVFERVTLDVDLEATFDNPFDADDVRIDAEVTEPNGKRRSAPGFFYQPFKRNDSIDVPRRTEPAGPPRWRVRLSFVAPGLHTVRLKARDRSGTAQSKPVSIRVSNADTAGMIRLSAKDHRYFATDRGESWFAVGANVCWGETWGKGGKHVFSYDDWLPRYAENGCNFARLWLSLEWNDLALITRDSGFDGIDLQRAWHIDHVLELAEKYDIRLMLCFDAHGMLRTEKRQYGSWEMSPLHPDNGAPISKPIEFFTNARMLKAYRNRLRYLVARYGYSTSLFSWEFFNEVDLIDDYDSEIVAKWHAEMARYLRQVDPWDHLITTSYARQDGDPRVDGLKELDFVQTHHYQAPDIARDLAADKENKAAAKDRPHFHGEFGISHSGKETGELDPTGIHLHNGLYSSVGRMDAGTAMTWWWDSYVHPRDLYHVFGAFSRWIEGFDFIEQNPQPIQASFEWKAGTRPAPPPLRASGVIGKDRGLVWVQNPNHIWSNAKRANYKPLAVKDAVVVLNGIRPGRWTVEYFDSHAGKVTKNITKIVGADGRCVIDLPETVWDAAFRLQRNTLVASSRR